jgi:hypothetical protein
MEIDLNIEEVSGRIGLGPVAETVGKFQALLTSYGDPVKVP